MKTINYAGLLLLSFAVACQSPTTDKSGEKVVENTVVSQEPEAIPNDNLIVPGKQIGALYLGQDMKEVFKLLGTPNDGDAAMGSALGIWKKDSITIFSSYRDSNMVVKAAKQISVGSPAYQTADHLHTGMMLPQLQQALPVLKLSARYVNEKSRDTLKVFDDKAGGIAFDIEQNRCSRITVHPKDKSVNGTYLSMYPGWKLLE